jgi:hypothetical protein
MSDVMSKLTGIICIFGLPTVCRNFRHLIATEGKSTIVNLQSKINRNFRHSLLIATEGKSKIVNLQSTI